MSASAWVDLVVVILALLAAASGFRQGALASGLAFVGVVLGAVAGILLAPHVISHLADHRWRLVVGIGMLVILVIIGEVSGMVLGRAARSGLHSRGVRAADSVIGSLLQGIAVLVAAWLLAIPVSSSSEPQVATAVRNSRVLSGVNEVAPQWLRKLPKDFSNLLDTSGLPSVIGPFGHTPVAEVDPPDETTAQLPVVIAVQASVVKIEGVAPSCNQALEGSGFVVAPGRVMTNAHVVAGTRSLRVTAAGTQYRAHVVLFDSRTDIAILSVPQLDEQPLTFAASPVESGHQAIALGYPEAGPYTATPVRVRDRVRLTGPDIYESGQVTREVYTVRGVIRQGNSGGPLIDTQGEVLGVVFGAAEDTTSETGFALTAQTVQADLELSSSDYSPVDTGACVHS
ncbi:acid resistance serine protease MarP [Gordonia jinhuaensis]|uniref:Membrane-associated serine protease n=1 Tax=Gordonia jinhuaensis TaxID=1517702 RepID=A0A916T9D1_9ACTN|nr:MarP family serine protease [Gordonia jinhuaensis]GGB35641.1 putative membrane-associated serine protease [Gordonia jinhuaensis]